VIPARFAAETHAEAAVEVRRDGQLITVLPVTKDNFVIGRRATNDCRLEHETVSRLHAVIYREPGGPWRIRDLGSHNGTYVAGRRITHELLGPNTTAAVGVFELRLVRTLARAAPTNPPGTGDRPHDDADTRAHAVKDIVRDDDRTVSHVRSALETEISDTYRVQLQDLARRVRVLESQQARRRQLCDFLYRAPELAVVSAAVVVGPRSGEPERFRLKAIAPASDVIAPDAPPSEAQLPGRLLQALLDRWVPVRGATHGSVADITMTSVGAQDTASLVACPLSIDANDRAELLVAAVGADADARAMALIVRATEQYAAALEEAASLDLREEYRSYRDQLRLAEQLQRSLAPAPKSLANLATLDVAVRSEPSERVSGDYVDAFEVAPGKTLVLLADVTGHGLGAAIVAAQTHTMVHAHPWDQDDDLAVFVTRVSKYLCRFTPDHITVTALALMHDSDAGTLTLVNAGHHPVLIVEADGTLRTTSKGANALLGLDALADEPIAPESIHIPPDGWIVGFSDGVPEQRNEDGVQLGYRGAAQLIADTLTASPQADSAKLAQHLSDAVTKYQGVAQQSDDRTLFVLRGRNRI
jgi:sigma-B regulation protein RsbU (phosphoserine phosphatase)